MAKRWRDLYDKIPADRRARIEEQVRKDNAAWPNHADSAVVLRLLAALEAGEALARTLTENVHWCECWDEYQRPLPQCDRCKALAGWRAIVEGKDDAPKADQS